MNSAPSVLRKSVLPGLRSPARRLGIAGGFLSSIFCLTVSAQTNTFPESGNVGIGTTSPSNAKLEVIGDGRFKVSDANAAALDIDWDGTYRRILALETGGLNARPLKLQAQNFIFADDSATRVVIDSAGNVGIGTSAPAAKMDVFSGGSMTAGGYNGQLATLQVGHTGGAAANADGATIVLSQQYSSNDPASIVRVGAIVGYKGQADGSFGGGMKFRVQPAGANPLLDVMTLAMSGNVGIGTTNPASRLHIDGTTGTPTSMPLRVDVGDNGSIAVRGTAAITYVGYTIYKDAAQMWFTGREGDNYVVRTGSGANVITAESAGAVSGSLHLKAGNVGIGTSNPTHKLAVNGTIRAKEVIVDTGWADYVFAEDYRLAPLAEVEAHIRKKKHLPGIPSAAEVEEGGVSLGDMQARLLAKVEELTLHMIAQAKCNEEQQAELTALRAENARFRTELSGINRNP